MMIKKCDRCGAEMRICTGETDDNQIILGHWDDYEHRMTRFAINYDLCGKCVASFKEWVKDKKIH